MTQEKYSTLEYDKYMKNIEKLKEILGEKFSRDADFLNSVINELKLPNSSKILDVGTGWGFMAISLAL
ncbi:MAG: hypothetical protein ACFFEY_20320, partial [Candidatus Thorarchaeota archaeon]